MASDRVRELKAILDRVAEQAEFNGNSHPDEDESLRAEAISAFVAGGVHLLEEATSALWEYYRATIDEFTPEQCREYGLAEIPDSADIWEHVSFPHEESTWHLGNTLLERGRSYLSFEGEVSWEPEHGLQLVFEDGQRVCKAGPYDGHLT
jgi:hypothetical protein